MEGNAAFIIFNTMSIPKPKHCGQNWLDMTPAEGGRICGGCDKLIVDFTKHTWREIEEVQAANSNAVCGMYTDKQLQHWGQQPPTGNCGKLAASLALFASLASVTPANGQQQDSSSVRTVIHGCVSGERGGVDSVRVSLFGTKYFTLTDNDGNYNFDITDYVDTISKPLVHYEKKGYVYDAKWLKRGDNLIDISFYRDGGAQISSFYVQQPTVIDTVKHKLKRKKK